MMRTVTCREIQESQYTECARSDYSVMQITVQDSWRVQFMIRIHGVCGKMSEMV